MPEGCYWLYLCLIPRETSLNVDVHFKDLVFILTYEELTLVEYEPYGYKVPIRVNGKNKYSANTGVSTILPLPIKSSTVWIFSNTLSLAI